MREYKTDPYELDQLTTNLEPSSLPAELRDALRLVIDNLEEPHRQVLEAYFWEGCNKAELGERFGCNSNVQTAQLLNRAIGKAAEALHLYLEVGKVPAAGGRLRKPKAAVSLPSPVRSGRDQASGRHVSREDLPWPNRSYLVLSHGRRG